MKLSIVIPCYNSAKTIRSVVEDISNTFSGKKDWEYELILVNDCSRDATILELRKLANQHNNIIAIDLVKNVGQHSAMMAGFRFATGDIISTADDDGQTPLENIMLLIDKMNEGYDVVCARYKDRAQPSLTRRLGTKMSRAMSDWLIEKPKGIILSTFFVAKKFVIDEMIKYNQPYPFVTGLLSRVTQNIANVDMDQNARREGASGYNLKKLLSLWLNGFTAFSIKPLRVSSFAGMIFAGIGFLGVVLTIIRKIVDLNIAVGWSSIVSLLLIIGGLIMCMLGMIGEYVGRIYMCINATPQYVIKEVIK